MSNLFDLNGRTAIVTGGGRGIGREVARTLAGAGAQVAIAEIDSANAEDAADEIRSLGRESLAIPTDVRNSAAVEALVHQVEEMWGRIDILVNCGQCEPDRCILVLSVSRAADAESGVRGDCQHCFDVRPHCQQAAGAVWL